MAAEGEAVKRRGAQIDRNGASQQFRQIRKDDARLRDQVQWPKEGVSVKELEATRSVVQRKTTVSRKVVIAHAS